MKETFLSLSSLCLEAWKASWVPIDILRPIRLNKRAEISICKCSPGVVCWILYLWCLVDVCTCWCWIHAPVPALSMCEHMPALAATAPRWKLSKQPGTHRLSITITTESPQGPWATGCHQHCAVSLFVSWFSSPFNTRGKIAFSLKQTAGCFALENKIIAWKCKDCQLIQTKCERATKVACTNKQLVSSFSGNHFTRCYKNRSHYQKGSSYFIYGWTLLKMIIVCMRLLNPYYL